MIHTRSNVSLQGDSYGKKSLCDSYDTINVTTPSSACASVHVCLHVWEMSCWQQTAVTMSASEGSNSGGHANTLGVWPQSPSTPLNDCEMTDRVFMLAADVRQDIQNIVQNAKKGQLAQGKLSFLKTALSYRRKDSLKWINSINLSLVYLDHVFLNHMQQLLLENKHGTMLVVRLPGWIWWIKIIDCLCEISMVLFIDLTTKTAQSVLLFSVKSYISDE